MREEGAERVEGGTRLGLACRDGTGRGRVRGWWCRHEWSSSGSKGRGRDAARRGLGCRSGDETERAASSSWKAMIRSAARRRGDVDARWQDTLLRSSSGVNGVRAGVRQHLVVVTSSSFSCGVWWPGVRQQAASPQRLPLGLRWRQRRTEEGERGGRKRERGEKGESTGL